MALLKLMRFACALVGIGLTIFGVVSLFQGEWQRVMLSIGAYVVLAFIWYPINQAVERAEFRSLEASGY